MFLNAKLKKFASHSNHIYIFHFYKIHIYRKKIAVLVESEQMILGFPLKNHAITNYFLG
jgi:hypothetical protein